MLIDEPITLCDYDANWPELFEQEKAVILQHISYEIIRIEHIGSTAVPSLAAKPIIDIMLGLKHYPIPDKTIQLLQGISYEFLGETGVPGRLYFRKRQPKAFNIAAVEYGSLLWNDNLLLRNYLRIHSEERQIYEQHKRSIIAFGHQQLLAYSEQKATMVSDLLKRAKAWADL